METLLLLLLLWKDLRCRFCLRCICRIWLQVSHRRHVCNYWLTKHCMHN